MSESIILQTEVNYHQFLELDNTLEFLVDDVNLKKGSDFLVNSEDEITFINGKVFVRTDYIFIINSSINIWFDNLQEIFIKNKTEAEHIISRLKETQKLEQHYIKERLEVK